MYSKAKSIFIDFVYFHFDYSLNQIYVENLFNTYKYKFRESFVIQKEVQGLKDWLSGE